MTNLKNYTSNVPYERTIAQIERCLADCGVTGSSKQYADGVPVALYFHIDLGVEGRYTVRLPANVEQVQTCLYDEFMKHAVRPRRDKADFAEQAVRTAWKLQEDWVRVQMSLVKLKQADFRQVFMGFLWTGTQTYFEQVKDKNLRLLADATAETDGR